jgi:hypothetical protein
MHAILLQTHHAWVTYTKAVMYTQLLVMIEDDYKGNPRDSNLRHLAQHALNNCTGSKGYGHLQHVVRSVV